MKKFLHVLPLVAVLLSTAGASAAEEIITTPPEGREVEVYADFRSEENVYGFVWDFHSIQKVVYAADGKVYIPNVLMRNTMPGYLVGVLNESDKTVTVDAGQLIFKFPNIETDARVYMLNGAGLAGNVDTGTYNSEPLVFDVAENGTLTLRTPEDYPMFGIAGSDAVDAVYAVGANLQFVPVELSASLIKHYKLTYIYDNDETEYSVAMSGYADGDNVWFKGFNPRYPNAWMRATWVDGELIAPSFQLLNMSSTELPTVMAASSREMNASGEYEYTHAYAFKIDCDKAADSYSAFVDNGMYLTNLTSYDDQTADVWQAYRKMRVSPVEIASAVPANPVFDGYDPTATSKETEFKFYAYAKDRDGDELLKDALALRYYVNGEVYVFRKAVYTKLPSDMELIPFTYADNSAFLLSSDGNKHYTYFLNTELPADLKTIGVEVVYTVDGVTTVSDRLVYDVATGTTSYAGLTEVAADKGEAVEVGYYDICGRPTTKDATGVVVKVVRYANGETETTKVVLK